VVKYRGLPRRGELVTLTIRGITPQGQGEARLTHLGDDGISREWGLEVRNALPGDEVEACIVQASRRKLAAATVRVLRPSPARRPTRCPHAGMRIDAHTGCGGCPLQALDYPTQLAAKEEMVARAMRDEGLSVPLAPIIPVASPWFYRNKMELTFAEDGQGRLGLGLHPMGYKHEVIDLRACFLLSPFADLLAPHVSAWAKALGLEAFIFRQDRGFLRTLTIREGKRSGQRVVILTTAAEDPVNTAHGPMPAQEVAASFSACVRAFAEEKGEPLDGLHWMVHHAKKGQRSWVEDHVLAGPGYLREALHIGNTAPLHFKVHPLAFFQPNTLQAERLYEEVALALGEALTARGRVYDLYCGTGTIALSLARRVHSVVGVDLSAEAIANAVQNAQDNGLANVTFIAGDVGEVLEQQRFDAARGDVVVVDPPRRGLLPGAKRLLLAMRPRRLVYVSCNPLALAADLIDFRDAGYQVTRVQPIDMLPQTGHVECVASLSLP